MLSPAQPRGPGPVQGFWAAASLLHLGSARGQGRCGLGCSLPTPTLPRHQVLRISAADEAQVQKVKELEDLEHLQVRRGEKGSPRPQGISWGHPRSPPASAANCA